MAHKKTWDFSDAPKVSRAEAKASGLKQFFDGVACAKGHIAPRYTRMSNCVVCSAEASLSWQKRMYLNQGETYREYRRGLRFKDPVGTLLRVARSRAKKKGIEFSITKADLPMPGKCPCCDGRIAMRSGPTKSGPTPESPSIDRMDSTLGYVAGNVAIICWRCNELKRDASLDELKRIVSWIEKAAQKRKTQLTLVG